MVFMLTSGDFFVIIPVPIMCATPFEMEAFAAKILNYRDSKNHSRDLFISSNSKMNVPIGFVSILG